MITWILLAPTSFNTTSKDDFSSAAPAAAPAAGAAAATADTPYFSSIPFTNSDNSTTVKEGASKEEAEEIKKNSQQLELL